MLKAVVALFVAAAVGMSAPVISVQTGDSEVQITWKAPSSPVDYVLIDQSTNAGASWKQIDQIPGQSTSYLVEDLKNGTSYWFRVRFLKKGIPSEPSQAMIAIPDAGPPAPENLNGIGGDGQVALDWDNAPADSTIVGYEIDLSTDGGDTWKTVVADTGSRSSRWLVEGLKNGDTYTFRVAGIGFNRSVGEYSNATSVLVGIIRDETFELNSSITGTEVALDWTTPELTSTLDTYRIEVSTDGGVTWSTVQEVDANITKANVPYVIGGALYRIVATSIKGESAISIVNLIQILDDPNAPDAVDGVSKEVLDKLQALTNNPDAANGGGVDIGKVTTNVNGGIGTRATLPAYTATKDPQRVLDTSVGGLAVLGLLAGAAGGRTLNRKEDESASLEGIDYEDLDSFDGFEEYGDRSNTWRWPNMKWTLFVERITHAIASELNRFTPLLARMFRDGSYLRAMYGSLALSTWIFALALGTFSVLETSGEALPPKTLTLLLLIALGVFDTAAAALATVVVFIGTLISGGYDSIPAVRTTLGLSILLFGPILIASAVRPLRRKRPDYSEEEELKEWQWERTVDYLLGSFMAAFAARSMVNGLPALAGLNLPIAKDANLIAIAVGILVAIRYGLEDNATQNYPMRLKMVEANELKPTFKVQQHASILLKGGVFFFVAYPFLGSVWQLYVGTALFLLPAILSNFAPRLPKLSAIARFLPTGLPQFTLMLLIGAAYSAWVSGIFTGKSAGAMAFILLSIPTLILSLLHLFAGEHHGARWNLPERLQVLNKVGAAALFIATIFLALR
jgi:hypothetical protein